jgi:RNA-directed DNA polymerase
MVKDTSSPDDPALTGYWAARRRRGIPRPMDIASLRLLEAQHGRCPLCRELLLDADRPPQSPHEWEQWLTALLRAHCYRQYARSSKSPALLPASEPTGLA